MGSSLFSRGTGHVVLICLNLAGISIRVSKLKQSPWIHLADSGWLGRNAKKVSSYVPIRVFLNSELGFGHGWLMLSLGGGHL